MGRNVIGNSVGRRGAAGRGVVHGLRFQEARFEKGTGLRGTAVFQRVDGLKKTAADVMVNGIKVGSVLGQELITGARARSVLSVRVHLSIEPKVVLPADTMCDDANESLLGGRYLSLEIGAERRNHQDRRLRRITHTQRRSGLDDLIGKLLFSSKTDSKKDDSKTTRRIIHGVPALFFALAALLLLAPPAAAHGRCRIWKRGSSVCSPDTARVNKSSWK